MKRIKRMFVTLLATVMLFSAFPLSAYAGDGSGNMDGGGGDMGGGTSQNIWHNGDDGIRITVVRASDNKPVSASFDMANRNEGNPLHFVKKSKLTYRSGSALAIDTNKYSATKPSSPIPTIITGNSTNNIAAIKNYFTDKLVIKYIASIIGVSYDKLTCGSYKLLLEPIAYFTFNGVKWSMTATEAAKYDLLINGKLRSKMVSLSHQNLPLSMFLEHSDMGYPAYQGSTSRPQSDAIIISSLGLGVVKFRDDGKEDPEPVPGASEATYRTDTDVVTSVLLDAGSQIDPDGPASVTFHIMGKSYTRTGIVIPEGESQLVWVKWHTPKKPQSVNITVSASKGTLSENRIRATVAELTEKTPPDPTAKDRNDRFKVPAAPAEITQPSNAWSVWSAAWKPVWNWIEHWVWVNHAGWSSGGEWVDKGHWVDAGYWEYKSTSYKATLSADMKLLPDDKVPTAKGKKMRSGYGVKITVTGNMRSSARNDITSAQTAVTYFPEFTYKTYWRVLDRVTGGLSSEFSFRKNEYSTYNRRVHFTPVWYPDDKYTAYTLLEDAWTPSGMLTARLTDDVIIKGSVYDDWHTAPLPVK